MVISRKLYAVLAVPALTLAACGSSSGGNSDKDQLESLIKDVAAKPATLCDHITPALLKQLGGSVAACKKVAAAEPADKKADISNLKVTGDKATATITDSSGKNDAKFEKVGGDWKVAG